MFGFWPDTWLTLSGTRFGIILDPFRIQAVSTPFSDEEPGVSGIRFNFLTKAINMSFQGMGGDRRIVPPNLIQEDLASNRTGPCPVQEFQDRRLLLRESDASAFGNI
jgi:hypothetical protein